MSSSASFFAASKSVASSMILAILKFGMPDWRVPKNSPGTADVQVRFCNAKAVVCPNHRLNPLKRVITSGGKRPDNTPIDVYPVRHVRAIDAIVITQTALRSQ